MNSTQHSTWEQIAPRLTGLAQIATCSADGQPHVAVVTPLVKDEVVCVFTRRASSKARNLQQNPRLSMMRQPAAEIYLRGFAELVEDPDDNRRLWISPQLMFDPEAFFHRFDHPDFLLVRVTPLRATLLQQGGPVRWRR